jgi:hypothetical protein
VYIGSANNDWKSLTQVYLKAVLFHMKCYNIYNVICEIVTNKQIYEVEVFDTSSVFLLQVKELGIYFAGCPQIAKTVEVYFENLWTLATLNSTTYTKVAWDKQWQIFRKVPCWSHFLHPKQRCRFVVFSVTPSV